MFKKPNFGHGMLTAFFISGLLWFFAGRLILGPIEITAVEIRAENITAQQIGGDVAEGHTGMERTATKLTARSEIIENRATRIVTGSESSISRFEGIETGVEGFSNSVRGHEKRYGLVVGIVGEIRDISEEIREAIEELEVEN